MTALEVKLLAKLKALRAMEVCLQDRSGYVNPMQAVLVGYKTYTKAIAEAETRKEDKA